MRNLAWLLALALAGNIPAAGRDSLFGRTTGGDTAPPSAEPSPAKEGDAPKDAPGAPDQPKADKGDKDGKGGKGGKGGGRGGRGGQGHRGDKDKGDDGKPDEDVGVIIRPVKLDEGVVPSERLDFQISRIDKPLARETSVAFREAWAAFRQQNQLNDAKVFVRSPQAPATLKATLLQDLGDGRWLVDAAWTNAGQHAWCEEGERADRAVLVLGAGEGKAGDAIQTNALHVGVVEVRFDCKVAPAEGRRITLRRHAFLAMPTLPDDAATRDAFQQAVSSGKPPVEVILAQVRECKDCRGVGYIRRPVPGRIQDAHDPCPGNCDRGRQRVPVLVTFRP